MTPGKPSPSAMRRHFTCNPFSLLNLSFVLAPNLPPQAACTGLKQFYQGKRLDG
jgi:hypothetical protein